MGAAMGEHGPLFGYRIIELAGMGPGPYAAMMLADMGAEVIRVDRLKDAGTEADGRPTETNIMARGRRSVAIDLKRTEGRDAVLRLVERADGLIEAFRPGVTERLGIGPEACLQRNPRLVYGRLTGWGQDGPYAQMAGHDINYISLAGALSLIGTAGGPPVLPLNLIGDYAGGGLLAAFGIVCALLETTRSGKGQVVDAAMIDGTALVTAVAWGLKAAGLLGDRGTNLLDGGAPQYNVYETADGSYISLGSLEPRFYDEMARIIGLGEDVLPPQVDTDGWPETKRRIAALIKAKTSSEWCHLLEGTDACFSPVLTLDEARDHEHLVYRNTFIEVAGVTQPAPAPRFSRTPPSVVRPPASAGEHTDDVLRDWGFETDEVTSLRQTGAVG